MIRRRWKMLRHRVRRLAQVGPPGQRLLAEATLALVAARLRLATVPFPRIARGMGGFVPPPDPHDAAPPSAGDAATARDIGWAVTRAAQHLPFAAVCLPQAMAARAMLRRRGIRPVIHFGTVRGEAFSLAAHAWSDVGPVAVTGYPVGADVTEIACLTG